MSLPIKKRDEITVFLIINECQYVLNRGEVSVFFITMQYQYLFKRDEISCFLHKQISPIKKKCGIFIHYIVISN